MSEGDELPAPRTSPRNHMVVSTLAFLGGFLGLHRFYVGKHATGAAMLLTGGGLLIWWVVDAFRILSGTFRDAEGRLVRRGQAPEGELPAGDD